MVFRSRVPSYDVHLLPEQFVEQVATGHLPALGAVVTVFAQERADYVVVSVEGPFKRDSQSMPTKTDFNRADDAFQGFFCTFP